MCGDSPMRTSLWQAQLRLPRSQPRPPTSPVFWARWGGDPRPGKPGVPDGCAFHLAGWKPGFGFLGWGYNAPMTGRKRERQKSPPFFRRACNQLKSWIYRLACCAAARWATIFLAFSASSLALGNWLSAATTCGSFSARTLKPSSCPNSEIKSSVLMLDLM